MPKNRCHTNALNLIFEQNFTKKPSKKGGEYLTFSSFLTARLQDNSRLGPGPPKSSKNHKKTQIFYNPPAPACQGPPGCVNRCNPVSCMISCILYPRYRILYSESSIRDCTGGPTNLRFTFSYPLCGGSWTPARSHIYSISHTYATYGLMLHNIIDFSQV